MKCVPFWGVTVLPWVYITVIQALSSTVLYQIQLHLINTQIWVSNEENFHFLFETPETGAFVFCKSSKQDKFKWAYVVKIWAIN